MDQDSDGEASASVCSEGGSHDRQPWLALQNFQPTGVLTKHIHHY